MDMKLFRKKRAKEIKESRFKNYLIYALGEIVLVVIGILIAIQVNNYYGDIKEKNKVINDLFELQIIIQDDLHSYPQKLAYDAYSDSLAKMVLNSELDTSDYLASDDQAARKRELFNNVIIYWERKLHYDKILNNPNFQENFPEIYLQMLRVMASEYLHLQQQKALLSLRDKHNNYLVLNVPAYGAMDSSGMAEFYSIDPHYKNFVRLFDQKLQDRMADIKFHLQNLEELEKMISELKNE